MDTNDMGKVGSRAENPTLAIPNPAKVEKEKGLSGKMGSCSGAPAPTPAVQIKKEKETIPSGKAPLCSEDPPAMDQSPMEEPEAGTGPEKEKAKAKEPQREKKKKNLLVAAYGSSTSKPLPPAAAKLLEELMLLAGQLDEKYEEMDILDISAMKGIHFAPPRWHRPGGYDRKPNPTDKDKK